jgi:hypothetical protein
MKLPQMTLGLVALALCASSATAQVLASYDAGTAGNPGTAPDPTTQGWGLVYPLGTGVTLTDLSPDGATGLNAWQIADAGSQTGERAHYEQFFSAQQISDAYTNGWEVEFTMRVISSSGIDILCEYAEGATSADRRYIVWYEAQGSDVLATIWLAGTSYVCTNGMDGNYHTYMYRKAAGVDDAEFYYDGTLMGAFPSGAANAGAPDGGITWGTGSSAAHGTVNVNSVKFTSLSNADSGSPYCFGDGSGADCPCFAFGQTGEGCNNTGGTGATFTGSGAAAFSADTFQFQIDGVPGDKPGLILRADNQVANPIGDGILCAVGNSQRSHVQVTSAGSTTYTDFSGSPFGAVANAGGVATNFQFWYRDPTNTCSGSGFNFTNAWTVTYVP